MYLYKQPERKSVVDDLHGVFLIDEGSHFNRRADRESLSETILRVLLIDEMTGSFFQTLINEFKRVSTVYELMENSIGSLSLSLSLRRK